MTLETSLAVVLEQIPFQPPLRVDFGNVDKSFVKNSLLLENALITHVHGAHIAGEARVIPTGKGKPNFWKRPPKSVTFIALAANDPTSDKYNAKVEQSERDGRNSVEMGRRVSNQFAQGGGLYEDLQHTGESIVGVKKMVWKEPGQPAVALTVFDRRQKGEKGADRVVVASYWRDEVARAGVEVFNARVAQHMGEGKILKDTELEEIADLDTEKGRRFHTRVFTTLHQAAKLILGKRNT